LLFINHGVIDSAQVSPPRSKNFCDEIGLDGTLAELNCGGLIPHERVLNALRLLCQQAMPRFQ